MSILGIDYGGKRLGFAISDPDGFMALVLRMVEVRGEDDAVRESAAIFRETGAARAVVGLPLNMDGSRGPMVEKTERFVARLQEAIGAPVATWDERLSTSAVERALIADDVSRAKRKQLRDKLAAQVILQSYLDSEAIKADAEDEER